MKLIGFICLTIISLCWASRLPLNFPVPLKVERDVRIIGGQVAANGQFPWQVAVYFDTANGTYFCGGALVASNWVLTSGHCVYHATVFTLHLGSNTLVDDDSFRVTLGASYSVPHPDFNPESLVNNIGLIRIDTPYTTNERIQAIPLATSELGAGVDVTVSGWGATGDWDGVVDNLNYVTVKSISNADCKAVYGDAVTDDMVCAVGTSNEGTCDGDNGGPLVTVDASGNAQHVGIVSWVSTSGCKTNHPSGYTRTSVYSSWVQSVIG